MSIARPGISMGLIKFNLFNNPTYNHLKKVDWPRSRARTRNDHLIAEGQKL